MGTLVFENVKIADIHGYEHNAKMHPESQVQQIISSINKFGFNNPILIDENNEIIAGHGRFGNKTVIEDASSGTAIIQFLHSKGVHVEGIKPEKDKETRLTGITHLLENGTVLFPNQQDGEMRDFFE